MYTREYAKYWFPAARNLFGNSIEANVALENALDMEEYSLWEHSGGGHISPMSCELKKLLKLLAGPHGHTILKMYRIQKGLVKDVNPQKT